MTAASAFGNLRHILIGLDPVGPNGFEGLIKQVFENLTGEQFRLASSGSQRGQDGSTSSDLGIAFEAKRYDGSLNKEGVKAKLSDFVREESSGVWALCATVPIGTQLAADLRQDGEKNGVHVLLLDWSETTVSDLLLALSASGDAAVSFLRRNSPGGTELENGLNELAHAASADGAAERTARLIAELRDGSNGFLLARRHNRGWLRETFSDPSKSRVRLQQRIVPAGLEALPRSHLVSAVRDWFVRPVTRNAGTVGSALPMQIGVVHGREGVGKSWLLPRAWQELDEQPLMLFVAANEIGDDPNEVAVRERLLSVLATQASGPERQDNPVVMERWRSVWARWSSEKLADGPRLLVVLDGLNQQPSVRWDRMLETMAREVDTVGGRLVVTVRTRFLEESLRDGPYVAFEKLAVPEWDSAERDSILRRAGIEPTELSDDTLEQLRNPRLLAVALSVSRDSIHASPSTFTRERLLFDYLRSYGREHSEIDDPLAFADKLKNEAAALLLRIRKGGTSDVAVFEETARAAADGAFYRGVPDEPRLYEITPNGLPVALGFAILNDLRREARHGDPSEVLERMLEPIRAFDDVAGAVVAALVVSEDTHQKAEHLRGPLVNALARLQNVAPRHVETLAAHMIDHLGSALDALKQLHLGNSRAPNMRDIRSAAVYAASHGKNESETRRIVGKWLRVQTLEPHPRDHPPKPGPGDPALAINQTSREEAQRRIASKHAGLTESERVQLAELELVNEQTDDLHDFGFRLLAGTPLQSLGADLVLWCFGQALNQSNGAPFRTAEELTRLNVRDWHDTRDAIRRELAVRFPNGKLSDVGSWTTNNSLRLCGDGDDARTADPIYAELTRDRRRYKGWRRLDDYCSVDPCDPSSENPEHVERTADDYGKLELENVFGFLGGIHYHSFTEARAAMARFAPEVAIGLHRDFLRSGLSELPERRDVLVHEFVQHTDLVDRSLAETVLRQRHVDGPPRAGDDRAWARDQELLQLTYDRLSATEQFVELMRHPYGYGALIDVLNITKPLPEGDVLAVMEAARGKGPDAVFITLCALAASRTPVPVEAVPLLVDLVRHEDERVRAQVMHLAAAARGDLLAAIVEADPFVRDDPDGVTTEDWYSSMALLAAREAGLLSPEATVERVSMKALHRTVPFMDGNVAEKAAQRLEAAFSAPLLDDDVLEGLRVTQVLDADGSLEVPAFRVEAGEPDTRNDSNEIAHSGQSSDDPQVEAHTLHDRFTALRKRLGSADASTLFDVASAELFDRILSFVPGFLDRLHGFFGQASKARLSALRQHAFALAVVSVKRDDPRGAELMKRLAGVDPTVKIRVGVDGVLLDHAVLFELGRHPNLDSFRFEKLDTTRSDADTSAIIAAAEMRGLSDVLDDYVRDRIAPDRPLSSRARALSVTGLRRQSQGNHLLFEEYVDAGGELGRVARYAKVQADKARWSEHWLSKAVEERDPSQRWRWLVLSSRVADRRTASSPLAGQLPSGSRQAFSEMLNVRLRHVEKERGKKLHGRDSPYPFFIAPLE